MKKKTQSKPKWWSKTRASEKLEKRIFKKASNRAESISCLPIWMWY